ncbi:amino acid ABC transporter ATP-binding protein [Cetobacterium sp. SF1]|uniref:amino acid ABC transporter ATP-binding protein n=1 Tax=Cetobacterium sp. SF1 TaxID=3417654 RepID=UPI003CEC4D58
MIIIRNLVKKYKDNIILDNINLEINSGEIISIVGNSGCGKTTLLKCLVGLETPTQGIIDLNSNKIGMVFQHFNLFPHKTALENIIEPLITVYKKNKEEAIIEGNILLKKLNLENKGELYPKHLSGGQKQRIAIARAIISNPKYLILDEPTSALDPNTIEELKNILIDFNKEGMTLIIVSHDLKFVEDISHRIIKVEKGRIKEEIKKFDV